MKLRFRHASPSDTHIHFGEQWRAPGGWVCLEGKVLQQWHEQTVSIPIDGVVTEQVVGEWRDVEIVTE